tara:strand:- start:532 stop:840 length:309 start_codon:yes stop_codon:yes gene_type:complete
MKIFLYLVIIFLTLNACQATKDALTLKKKPSSDEFLVEKKSPLVLPPNYGDLPKPDEKNMNEQKTKNEQIEISLGDDKLKMDVPIKNSEPTSLEQSVLKKIK